MATSNIRDRRALAAVGIPATGARVYPCPTCREPNRLTRRDRQLGYQCNGCTNREEGYGP